MISLITILFISLSLFAQSTSLTPEQQINAAKAELQSKFNQGQLNLQSLDDTFTSNGKEYKVSQFREIATSIIQSETEKIGKPAVESFLANYLTQNSEYLGEFKAFKDACTLSLDECDEQQKVRGYVLGNINTMYRSVHGNNGAEKFETEICEANIPILPNEAFWSQFTDMTLNNRECRELEPNQARKVRASGFGSDYLLRRTQDGKYQAVMNINFEYEGGNLTNVDMMNRMRDCLKKANPHMSSTPAMELVVLGEDDINRLPQNQRPAPQKITLKSPEFRSNSANYSDTAMCPTLIHEALHLLNLCDEYQERDTATYDWTCRIVTTTDSIMANSFEAFPRSVPQSVRCQCPANSDCGKVMNSTNEAAKMIYLAEDAQDMANGFFWVDYCSRGSWNLMSSIPTRKVERGTVNPDNNSFTVVQRTVIGGPTHFTFLEKTDTCTFQTTQTNPVLIAEERSRFVAQRENMFRRIDAAPRSASCPFGATHLDHEDKLRGTPGAEVSGDVLTINRNGEGKPLLHPNHVNRILSGRCESKAINYRRCADLSQKSMSSCNQEDRAQCSEDNFLRISGDQAASSNQ